MFRVFNQIVQYAWDGNVISGTVDYVLSTFSVDVNESAQAIDKNPTLNLSCLTLVRNMHTIFH